MNNALSKKKIGLAVSCALSLGILAGVANAQTNPAETSYLNDQRGTVARSGFGLCWHTGTGPAVYTADCDPNPAQAAETVAAPPVMMAAAAPAAPAPRPANAKVTLDADTLFDFDKAVLRRSGMSALDDFLVKMKGIDPEVIFAVGHADRFGSDAYNQSLSERRATAVRSYLIGKGVADQRVHTEGKGETQPVTKAEDCAGAKSAKVIACLQPDRRVEIEVIGMVVSP